MTTLTKDQHTALLAAKGALWDKQIAAGCRGEAKSMEYLVTQYHVIGDLLEHATIEVEDAPTPLWRDCDREDWMCEGSIYLELVDAPYVVVGINPAWIERGTSVTIEDADDMVAVLPEHLPALIAMLTEVQRRIGGEAK